MTQRNRNYLVQEFKDGERPSGTDFSDLIESFLNKEDDGLSVDTEKNLILSHGLRLGDSTASTAGGLRFHGSQVQFHNGTDWVAIASGGGGAFQPVGGGADVAHNGNVGIGSFTNAPTYRLEVDLAGANSDATGGALPANQVRFGNAVCSNGGPGRVSYASFSHRNRTANTDFALRQGSSGDVQINAPTNQPISIRQNGGDSPGGTRLLITAGGLVVVGSTGVINSSTAIFQVFGEVCKTGPGTAWTICSDARLKEDVRDLETGLAQLRQVRPVRFRYNGRAGTPVGIEGVGILGQEIEKIFPEMIKKGGSGGEPDLEDLRMFDGSALTFVLVNAVKELAAKVEQLEAALALARNDPVVRNPD